MYADASDEGRNRHSPTSAKGSIAGLFNLGGDSNDAIQRPVHVLCLMLTPLLGMAQETSPPVQELKSFLAKPANQRGDLAEQPFAQAC